MARVIVQHVTDPFGHRQSSDIGFVLITSSCEGARGVGTSTVTAQMQSPLSRYQTPTRFSQNQSVFSGVATLRVASLG